MSERAHALAQRIEQGTAALASFAERLSDADWATIVPGEERTVGVLIHHVASMYPLEVDLAESVGSDQAIPALTWDALAQMNAKHAADHASTSREDTIALLRENGRTAAARVRALTDAQLDRAAPVSMSADAPLTAQFTIENQAVRHSFHHLAGIRAALGR